jgi:4-hydroxy-3-methylbut-2-enyl diphosphate reductase
VGEIKIRISDSAGFCWGVERALAMAHSAAAEASGPINTLGPLIHNPGVIAELNSQGIGMITTPEEADSGTVILRSHGVPREIKEQLENSGLNVLDATCRFVELAQDRAAQLQQLGYFVLILGEKDHPEVLALRSYAGSNSLVVEEPRDLPEKFPSTRMGVVVQTTQSQQRLSNLVAYLAPRTRELLVYNTICGASEERQASAMDIADEVDVVIVVGGRDSANTRRLAEICSAAQPRTYHIETADEIEAGWFAGARTVGITAGASTPPEQIEAVVSRIREVDP